MAEFEYHPDTCSVCFRLIAPDGPVAIIDGGRIVPPQYYHIDCLFESTEMVKSNYNYWRKRAGRGAE